MRRYKMWAIFTRHGSMEKSKLFTNKKAALTDLSESDKQAGYSVDRVYVERAFTNGK